MKVLIVDDNKENLYLLERMLKNIGHEVVMAENGKQALERLQSDNFKMIISDILMPVMDGYQLCHAVRSNEEFSDILFVFYTATYVEKPDEELALKMGANKFIRKPMEPEKFIKIIENLLQNTEPSQVKPKKDIFKEEKGLFKLYSERLVNKLEQKFLALEKEKIERQRIVQKLRENEEKYRVAYNRAELYKDLFAHDISNILQSILSGVQLTEQFLGHPEKFEYKKKTLEGIKEQVIRGANLVSNVRNLSQLESVKISLKRVNICKILKNSIAFVKNAYSHRKINIQVNSIGEILYIQANYFLNALFENILTNSVKHNKNPMVRINIRVFRVGINEVNYLKIEFLDNGTGVEDARKENIFLRGVNEDKGAYGIGFGLWLVKNIVDSYNGKIWVEDRVKGDHTKGSNFVLLIPEVV